MYLRRSPDPTPANVINGAAWKARQDRAKAKIALARDPATHLKNYIRANMGSDPTAIAREEYDRTHAPVPSGLPQLVHPDVAAQFAQLMTESGLAGRDLRAPIHPCESFEECVARHTEALVADRQRAEAELAALEREYAVQALREAEAALASVDARHVANGIELPVTPSPDVEAETVEAADAPRRPRGRPPRVSLDPLTADDALPVERD